MGCTESNTKTLKDKMNKKMWGFILALEVRGDVAYVFSTVNHVWVFLAMSL